MVTSPPIIYAWKEKNMMTYDIKILLFKVITNWFFAIYLQGLLIVHLDVCRSKNLSGGKEMGTNKQ